jgi:cobalt-zinc-cadmium efflux system outer membrane protein
MTFFRATMRRAAAIVCALASLVSLAALPLMATPACAQGMPAGARPLTLEEAVRIAQERNPDMRLAGLGVEGAGAAATIAGAAPNPVLTLQSFNINPGAGVGAGSLRSKTVDSAVRIDQLIERGGKRGLRLDQAGHLEDAARHDQRDTRRQLRLLVSQAYYQVLAARDRLAITRQSADLFDTSVAAAQKRQRAGDLAAADVARASVDALRARNDVVQAESDLFAARDALALLMAEPAGALPPEPSDDWPSGAPPGADAENLLLARRPDVLAAQARVDAAESARKLALASRRADVTVGVQAEHYPVSAANPQGSGNSYGLALQIPLALRYDYQGEIRAAEVNLDTANANLDKARAAARSELAVSAERARSAYARLRRDDDSLLAAAKKSADAAEFAFRQGAMDIMDLLDVRRTYRSTLLEALQARADYAVSLAAWQAAVSEGKTP